MMIVPERWITLSEIHARLSKNFLSKKDEDEPAQNLEAKVNELCWQFCKISRKVLLHKSGDEGVKMPKTYVKPPKAGTHLRANELVDLAVGVPGSGTVKHVAFGKGPKIYNISGPYIGSPIIFERKEFEKFFLNLNAQGAASFSAPAIKNATRLNRSRDRESRK